jgi:hypothetical protein
MRKILFSFLSVYLSFTQVGKSRKNLDFYSQGYILFHLSHQPNTVGVITFYIVDSILKFSVKKYSLSLHLVEMDTDPDPDRQALDAEPDPAKKSFM